MIIFFDVFFMWQQDRDILYGVLSYVIVTVLYVSPMKSNVEVHGAAGVVLFSPILTD
jgi:hypothetical protein